MPRAIVVIPTIRKEYITEFLQAWEKEFSANDVGVIVVEDNPRRSFEIARHGVTHYSWEDIDNELKKDAWIIPRRTDCIRSYGYWKAFEQSPDFIITLDDDCLPCDEDFVQTHRHRLEHGAEDAWTSTGRGARPRGIPYYSTERRLECVLNHGLWKNVPDYDAVTQLMSSRVELSFEPVDQTIPIGRYFPMCGMNLAFKPKLVPALYFLLMGKDYEYDRMGDIWAGIIVKKICDHLGYAVNSGKPLVDHRRASNVWNNLVKEAPGMAVNDSLWQRVDSVVLTGTNVKECYVEISEKLCMKGEYWDRLQLAMRTWSDLF